MIRYEVGWEGVLLPQGYVVGVAEDNWTAVVSKSDLKKSKLTC
jgi:hypothetical protein